MRIWYDLACKSAKTKMFGVMGNVPLLNRPIYKRHRAEYGTYKETACNLKEQNPLALPYKYYTTVSLSSTKANKQVIALYRIRVFTFFRKKQNGCHYFLRGIHLLYPSSKAVQGLGSWLSLPVSQALATSFQKHWNSPRQWRNWKHQANQPCRRQEPILAYSVLI